MGLGIRPRLPAKWLRSPVVHFSVLGALLFAVSELVRLPDASHRGTFPVPAVRTQASDADFSATRIRQLHQDLTRRSDDPPSAAALAALVRQAIDDDLLELEARRLGLGQGDPSIRTRLVQKMRAVTASPGRSDDALYQDAIALGLDDDVVVRRLLREKMRILLRADPSPAPVTDDDVRAYVARHPDRFVRPTALTLTHVFFSARLHGDRVGRVAEAALDDLRRRSLSPELAAELSDPFPLGSRLTGWSRGTLARHLGDSFADQILALPARRWAGPIASAAGLHLVWVHERLDVVMPPLHALRSRVAREVVEERASARYLEALDRLRSAHHVRLDIPEELAALRPLLTDAR